ncbi:uncharacterized protein LOC107366310 [Tetranychus urticae]|uniref:Uncharacterized protein n=1 Tax=Tetranychus urticae TaxID=32264 RepID=T1KQA0_TETUR|nr:uncharacterized protein LOC107366310 [Tetranychus urticae]
MADYVNFNSPTTIKRSIAIGAVALVATLITIGVVVTITIKHESSSSNSLKNGGFKIKFIEPQWIPFVDEDTSLVNAFVAGSTSQSRTVYVCRVNSTKALEILPGMLGPSNYYRSCEVTWGGKSYTYDNFEILVAKDPSVFEWKSGTYGDTPIGALSGGLSEWKDDLQISRAAIGSGKYIGKVHGRHSKAYVAYDDKEKEVISYEVLCLQDYSLG